MAADPHLRGKLTAAFVLLLVGAGIFLWDSPAVRRLRAGVARPEPSGSASAARPPPAPLDATAADVPETSSPDATDAGREASDAPAKSAVPPLRPLPFAPLASVTGEAYRRASLPAPRALGSGNVVAPGLSDPSRVVVDTNDGRGKLVEVGSGKSVSWAGKPVATAGRAGIVALEPVKGKPSLVRLRDDKVIAPRLEGAEPKEVFWCARGTQDSAVLAATATDGAKLYGAPIDDSFEVFAFHPLPLAAAHALACGPAPNGGWDLLVGDPPALATAHTPWFLPHEDACVRARVSPGDVAPRCVEYEPFVDAGATALPETVWAADGWVLSSSWFTREGWDRTVSYEEALGLARADGSGPGCHAHYILGRVPRAFVSCKGFEAAPGGGVLPGARLRATATALVTPDAILRLEERIDDDFAYGIGGASDYPVVAYAGDRRSGKDGELLSPEVETWIDLVGEKGFTTPRMIPLGGAPFGGARRVVLAAPVDEPTVVWLLDFEAGTRERVGAVDDCPGKLDDLTEDAGPPLLACTTRPPPHTVSTTLLWVEILDTRKKARIRTELRPELFFDEGLAVLSTTGTRAAQTKGSARLFAASWRAP